MEKEVFKTCLSIDQKDVDELTANLSLLEQAYHQSPFGASLLLLESQFNDEHFDTPSTANLQSVGYLKFFTQTTLTCGPNLLLLFSTVRPSLYGCLPPLKSPSNREHFNTSPLEYPIRFETEQDIVPNTMLQWMGGSRRKVTTAVMINITLRQKQYFEQRKRQQQQPAGLESYADGKRSCTLHFENNRSLDILSLVNVSTVSQDHGTSCINGDVDFTLNHQPTHHPPAILTSGGIPVDQSEINEESTPWNYGTEAEYSKKVSIHLPGHNEVLVGNDKKLDPFELSTTHQISVIDLLGDGGGNSNEEEDSTHAREAHVAFSIEDLGKVGTETPVHSPKIAGRSFPNGFSSPEKGRRQSISSRHFDYGFHDLGSPVVVMMQDIDFSPYDNSKEEPSCSRSMRNIAEYPNQTFLNFRKSSPFNCNVSKLQVFLALMNSSTTSKIAAETFGIMVFVYAIFIFCYHCPSFLDDSTDHLGQYESFCKNWVDQRNFSYDDYHHNKDLWDQDINFEAWNVQKQRSSIQRTENFDKRESPFPYQKHQNTEDLPGVIISETKWYTAVEIDNGVKDAIGHFVTEDARERLSLLSEESCSSTAGEMSTAVSIDDVGILFRCKHTQIVTSGNWMRKKLYDVSFMHAITFARKKRGDVLIVISLHADVRRRVSISLRSKRPSSTAKTCGGFSSSSSSSSNLFHEDDQQPFLLYLSAIRTSPLDFFSPHQK
ncbi:hypothetical protein Sango_0344900 [Sesamum angolense]|uniref:Uncharacterized protein n=1 Tax=Sesamum angolense TaxID=2727404 RepID=A0AAE1XAA1_9LAMI|nr:hypothetical protein Sango_0344900 [Sesamum angolense]